MNSFTFLLALGALATASAGILAPGLLASRTIINPGYHAYGAVPLVNNVLLPRGHGLEGQYVPDNLETLYDDGSYRPQLRATPLSPSPYGLVPSGSGLEGQYVHDLTEKLFDDGSYKPELRAQPLSPSPYGLVPSGSGLEGQYVHDYTEKLYDDGSYKGELAGLAVRQLLY